MSRYSTTKIANRMNSGEVEDRELTPQEQAERKIGPAAHWNRCRQCNILSDAPEYSMVDWEEKSGLQYHSSEIYRERHKHGHYYCAGCHDTIHEIEDKETARRIAAGEMQDPALKPKTPEHPVMPGLTRNPNG